MPLTLFVVEDNPVILERLRVTLEALAPVRVVGSCDNEASAARWLGDPGNRCDLVVIDVFLKSGSGIGVLGALGSVAGAAAGAPPAARRVVLTNYCTPTLRARCLALGADRVFDKSQDIDALIDYCRSLADTGGAGAVTRDP